MLHQGRVYGAERLTNQRINRGVATYREIVMVKRERSPVSHETVEALFDYLQTHWPSKFKYEDDMLAGSPMSALKPLNKGPWAVVSGSKRYPLMRVRTDNYKLIIEPISHTL